MKTIAKRCAAALLAAALLCGPGGAVSVCAEQLLATPETAAALQLEEEITPPVPAPSDEDSADAQSAASVLSELLPGEQGVYAIGQDENGQDTAAFSLRGGSELEDSFSIKEITPDENAQPLDMSDYEQGWDSLGRAVTAETGVNPTQLAALVQAADATRAALDTPDGFSQPGGAGSAVLPLTENDWSAVELLPGSADDSGSVSADASAVLYMIDKTHTLIRVADENGAPLDGATVTIQLKDDEGNLIGSPTAAMTQSRTDSHGSPVPGTGGTAVFKTQEKTCYGVLDIQYPGYCAITLLDADLTGGKMQTIQMEPIGDKGYYLRCVDLAGADILHNKTSLDLVNVSKDMTFTVMLCRGYSGRPWPDDMDITLALEAVNNGVSRTVATSSDGLTRTAGPDDYTAIYSRTSRWGQVGSGLLNPGDAPRLTLSDGSLSVPLGLTVQRAICPEASYSKYKFKMTSLKETSKLSTTIPGLENLELGIEIPALPVSVMVLPDGTVFAGASLGVPAEDLEQWAKGTLTPRQQDKARDGMQSLQNMMNDKLDKLEKGVSKYTGMMDGTKQKGAWGDPEESLLVGVMFGFLGGYNKNTGMEQTGGRIYVSITGRFGNTYNSVLMVGPVPVPWYMGFDVTASGSLDTAMYYQTKVPVNQTNNDAMVKAISNPEQVSSTGGNVTMGYGLGFALYVGVGIRKVLCAEVCGNLWLNVSICAYNNSQPAPVGYSYPHWTGTFGAGLTLSATALFFSVSYTIKKQWSSDSWMRPLAAEASTPADAGESPAPTGPLAALDLAAVSETDTTGDSYAPNPLLNTSSPAGGAGSTLLRDVQGDTQMQVVAVNDTEYLFRIASVDGHPRLVYQALNNNDRIHIVQPAEGGADAMHYAVMADQQGANRLYIALVTADFDGTDTYEQRAASTRITGLTWDLNTHQAAESVLVPKSSSNEITEPMATGQDGHCVPLWKEKKVGICWYDYEAQTVRSIGTHYALPTGRVEDGKAMFFMVRANGATVQMRGVDLKGQTTQEMVTIPVDSTLYWNGSLITTYCVQNGYVYFVIGNHFFVYYPDGDAMEAKWMNGQGEAFDGIGGTDACQLIIQPQYGCLVQLTPRMEPNADGQMVQTGYQVINYFYTMERYDYLLISEPQTYELDEPEPIGAFCATADYGTYPDGGKGLKFVNLIYTVPDLNAPENVSRCDIRQWRHELTDGVQAESVSLHKTLISKSDETFTVQVKVRNTTGGRKTQELELRAVDETGQQIAIEGGSTVIRQIFPGMAETLRLDLFIPENWDLGAHRVTLQARVAGKNGSRTAAEDWFDLGGLAVNEKETLTMQVDLSYPGDRVLGHVTITNETMNAASFANLRLMMARTGADGQTEERVLYHFGTHSGELTDGSRRDTDWIEHSYNLTVDLTDAWEYDEYIALYLDYDGDESMMLRTLIFLETPDPDVYVHVGTDVSRPLTGTTAGDGSLVKGEQETLTLTAAAAEGFRFVRWVDDEDHTVSTTPEWTCTLADTAGRHRLYTAEFADDGAHALTVFPSESTAEGYQTALEDGAVTVQGSLLHKNNVDGVLTAAAWDGSVLTLSAEPNEGYRFTGWYENDTLLGSDPTLTLTLSASRTLEARFAPGQPPAALRVSVDEAEAVNLSFSLRDAGFTTVPQAVAALQNALQTTLHGKAAMSAAKTVTVHRSEDENHWRSCDVLPDAETAAAVLNLPESVDVRGLRPAVAVLYQDAVDGHSSGEVLVLQNGQTVGGTSFSVTDIRTAQLTLRGSALVLLGWADSTVSPSAAPDSEHPEIGQAIADGTWGKEDTTRISPVPGTATLHDDNSPRPTAKPKINAAPSPTSEPVSTAAPTAQPQDFPQSTDVPSAPVPSQTPEPAAAVQKSQPPLSVPLLIVGPALGALAVAAWLLFRRRHSHER